MTAIKHESITGNDQPSGAENPGAPVKACTRCGTVLPATPEYFRASKTGKYGVSSECKECLKKRDRSARQSEPRDLTYASRRCAASARSLANELAQTARREILIDCTVCPDIADWINEQAKRELRSVGNQALYLLREVHEAAAKPLIEETQA